MDVTHFQEVVERNPGQQNVSEELGQWENTVDHPIRQPDRVVIFVCWLYGLHTAHEEKGDTELYFHQEIP